MIKAHVEGLDVLRRALLELPKELHKGPLRAAVSAAAKVVQDQAIVNAPEQSGTLKRAIYRTRSNEASSSVQESFIVGVRQGKKFQSRRRKSGVMSANRDAFYWRFLEFGTVKMAAKPFLRPAFDETKWRAVEAMRLRLAAAIQRAAMKLRWR